MTDITKRDCAIRLESVSFTYNGPLALEEVDLEIAEREFLGIVGPNGGGKSTLLKIIMGEIKPGAGRVSVLGKAPEHSRVEIGYVPQSVDFARDFPISVQEAVLLGRLGKTRILGGYRARDRELAHQAMQEAEVLDLKDRHLNQLSGGQLQRVLIARALVCDPRILILDEPTANIDLRAEENIFDLFKQLNERMTVIVVSHDIGFISEYVNRVACLNGTLICHATEEVTGKSIEELYGTPVRMIHHHH